MCRWYSVRSWGTLNRSPIIPSAGGSRCETAGMEALLEVPAGERRSPFDRLRRSPRRISSTAMRSALQRYREFRHLSIRGLDFSGIPPVRLKALTRYAAPVWAPSIADVRWAATVFGRTGPGTADADGRGNLRTSTNSPKSLSSVPRTRLSSIARARISSSAARWFLSRVDGTSCPDHIYP